MNEAGIIPKIRIGTILTPLIAELTQDSFPWAGFRPKVFCQILHHLPQGSPQDSQLEARGVYKYEDQSGKMSSRDLGSVSNILMSLPHNKVQR